MAKSRKGRYIPLRLDLSATKLLHASTFIFAGMDTTSNALAITLSLLSKSPQVQDKLRNEILEASKGEVLDYDVLVSLPYLDAVCRETLRLWAISPFLMI